MLVINVDDPVKAQCFLGRAQLALAQCLSKESMKICTLGAGAHDEDRGYMPLDVNS
ncbi:hypothetical protein [Thalassomonas actiniarum]|uniref:Uncharacterized protein n=1 Tax=Thalassomonas actiniarum TaxID=485447 RepID=A0AAF0C6T4_9GAMM|nr:hypothetical protein [Thalassomonas actiniarum]WDE02445.1 hypothetical protein SG35_028975 [Thalassomonas actiniarum]